MIRSLVIIAVAGFVLALGCLASVTAIAGRDLAANGWVWPEKWRNIGVTVNGPSPGARTPDEVRKMTWSGGDLLQIDLPGQVIYAQGDTSEVVIEGPAEILPFVALENGRVFLKPEADTVRLDSDDLEVNVIAPSVRRFVINGPAKLKVANFDQENLSVEINGSGDAVFEGRTDRLAVTVQGSGDADLRTVTTGDANVKVVGSGEAKVAATGKVRAEISGSGDIYLSLKPTSLETQVDGSGEVHEAN